MDSQAATHEGNTVSALHQAYVDKLRETGHIRSTRVKAAFRAVPRQLFLPGKPVDEVYSTRGFGITPSDGRKVSFATEPEHMAEMLELLHLEPGQRVLEIGAGTGYHAALIGHIVGKTGRVITIDIEEELVNRANAALQAAGIPWAQAICCDGVSGYAQAAPYDRILMTAGVWDVAPTWQAQSKPDGCLLVPLQFRAHTQRLVDFELSGDCLTGISRYYCKYLPMRGASECPRDVFRLGPTPDDYLLVYVDDREPVGVAESVYELLTDPGKDTPAEVRVTFHEIRSLMLWLAVREPGYCQLWGGGRLAEAGSVPCLIRFTGFWPGGETYGLLGEKALSLLTYPPGQACPVDTPDETVPFELYVRSFGQDDALAHRLIDQIAAWDSAGRPSDEGSLRVRVYPKETNYIPSADELVIEKRWTRLAINWR